MSSCQCQQARFERFELSMAALIRFGKNCLFRNPFSCASQVVGGTVLASSAMVPPNVQSSQDDHTVSKKPRRHRRRTKHRTQEIFAEEPAQASTSGNIDQKSWPWVAITESSATTCPVVVYTKDGRCVIGALFVCCPLVDPVHNL